MEPFYGSIRATSLAITSQPLQRPEEQSMTDPTSFLEKHAEDIFHMPYYLAQTAIGETDGGIASLFEADTRDCGSGFANAGGHEVAAALLEALPQEEIVRRLGVMAMPDVEQCFASAELLVSSAITDIADDVVAKWHSALSNAFPEAADGISAAPTTVETRFVPISGYSTPTRTNTTGKRAGLPPEPRISSTPISK